MQTKATSSCATPSRSNRISGARTTAACSGSSGNASDCPAGGRGIWDAGISALADWLLTEQIRQIFEESEQTYGSPRIFKELKLGRGMAIGEKRVARLMRQAGLVSIHAKKRKGSTTRGKEHRLAPDLVGRDFSVDAPDRLRVADLTQLTTWQGTCYVAVGADAYSRCASAGAFVPTRRSSSRSKRWTWRSGDAARCVRPAPSITATRARSTPRSLSPADSPPRALVGNTGTVGDGLDNAMPWPSGVASTGRG
jgi:putative transposase